VGAPADLQDGGKIGIDYVHYHELKEDMQEMKRDIKDLCEETKKQSESLAYIKGTIEGKVENNKMKATVISSLIVGITGIIVAAISYFKS